MDSEPASASAYHDGERRVQRRAGVRDAAERVAEMIQPSLAQSHRTFLEGQPLAVAATPDRDGRVWTSLLAGEPGFMRAERDDRVRVDLSLPPGNPLADHRRPGMQVGLLLIDPRDRSRLRVNGTATRATDDHIDIAVEEVYPNCRKYIQRRSLDRVADRSADPADVVRTDGLRDAHREWFRRADTFFIGSHHPQHGADASHRGGDPGFVTVEGDTLTFPDYPGNDMFCTLGNLTVTERAGLLLVDFDSGRVLQTTGDARVVWDDDRLGNVERAERLVELTVSQAVEIPDGSPLRWRLEERSPFNP